MTQNQENFISKLLDAQGFKNSTLKESYMAGLVRKATTTKTASQLINELLEEKKVNQQKNRIYQERNYLNASDLSAFTFCPASFAIKNTYKVPKTKEVEHGEKKHQEFHFENFLYNLKNKRYSEEIHFDFLSSIMGEDKQNLELRYNKKNDSFDEMFRSELVYRGYEEKAKPFISQKANLASKPDYIFKLPDGKQFVVNEKHTWHETVTEPWNSDVIQVLAYMYGIEQIDANKSHIIYFSWHYHNNKLKTRNPRLFTIKKNNKNKQWITSVFLKVNRFQKLGKIDFDILK